MKNNPFLKKVAKLNFYKLAGNKKSAWTFVSQAVTVHQMNFAFLMENARKGAKSLTIVQPILNVSRVVAWNRAIRVDNAIKTNIVKKILT